MALGKQYAAGHTNRMIKVPATPGGLAALEELSSAEMAARRRCCSQAAIRDRPRCRVAQCAQRRSSLVGFKSVYSIFVSRIDVYTKKHVPELIPAAEEWSGSSMPSDCGWKTTSSGRIRSCRSSRNSSSPAPERKNQPDSPDKYVDALAGADIQTDPPGTNAAIQQLTGKTFTRKVDQLPHANVLADIDAKVRHFAKLEQVLMDEGLAKFADPFNALLKTIASKR